MTQKSPVYGIYIFTTAFLFIIYAVAGLIGPGIFFWGTLVCVAASAVLMAAKRYILLAGALALGTVISVMTGGGESVVFLLTLLPTGLAIGIIIRFGWGIKEGMAAGAVVFALTALSSLLLLTYNATGSISSENVAKVISEYLNVLSVPFAQIFQVQNVDPSQIKAFFDLFKQFVSVYFIGIAGGIGVILSFLAALGAMLCVSTDKGARIQADHFRLSRVSGIVAVLVYAVFYLFTGYPQIVASNFVLILTPIFFYSGCVYIYLNVRQGTLFRSPLFFYGILFSIIFLKIIPTMTCVGVYYALNINWSKLKPQDSDGDDF